MSYYDDEEDGREDPTRRSSSSGGGGDIDQPYYRSSRLKSLQMNMTREEETGAASSSKRSSTEESLISKPNTTPQYSSAPSLSSTTRSRGQSQTRRRSLFQCIQARDYAHVMQLLKQNPAEACETSNNLNHNNPNLALHEACKYQPPVEVIDLLLQINQGAVKAKGQRGYLPLHFACYFNASPEVVAKLLIQYPSGTRARDDHDGRLALHLAAKAGASVEVILSLLMVHPKASLTKDGSGKTPLDHALLSIESLSSTASKRRREAAVQVAVVLRRAAPILCAVSRAALQKLQYESETKAQVTMQQQQQYYQEKLHRMNEKMSQRLEHETTNANAELQLLRRELSREKQKTTQLTNEKFKLEEELSAKNTLLEEQGLALESIEGALGRCSGQNPYINSNVPGESCRLRPHKVEGNKVKSTASTATRPRSKSLLFESPSFHQARGTTFLPNPSRPPNSFHNLNTERRASIPHENSRLSSKSEQREDHQREPLDYSHLYDGTTRNIALTGSDHGDYREPPPAANDEFCPELNEESTSFEFPYLRQMSSQRQRELVSSRQPENRHLSAQNERDSSSMFIFRAPAGAGNDDSAPAEKSSARPKATRQQSFQHDHSFSNPQRRRIVTSKSGSTVREGASMKNRHRSFDGATTASYHHPGSSMSHRQLIPDNTTINHHGLLLPENNHNNNRTYYHYDNEEEEHTTILDE